MAPLAAADRAGRSLGRSKNSLAPEAPAAILLRHQKSLSAWSIETVAFGNLRLPSACAFRHVVGVQVREEHDVTAPGVAERGRLASDAHPVAAHRNHRSVSMSYQCLPV